ncbi:hypothetical protein J6590_099929 [Homalodisca vitripennis]|nr:hypothetical protein J6590_090398 [Homalodisca vitripennis]KAG8282484.1 hypothetical protein J6590_036451 [Homalodisca vitripennis]KAG8308617.1 hypothetical protein J6590_105364 [Homalodisca vitripennis]KAG8333958.1 hypothetical protein J6590_099929 [Homalodisca vitripennis]
MVNSTRYLRMVLTNVTARGVFISVAQLLLYSSPLTTSTKMLLNKLIVRPYITYPDPVWYNQLPPEYILNHSNTGLFFPIWNSVGCSEQCYDALFGIPTLGDYIKAQARHLFESSDSSEWDHIRAWSSRESPVALHNLRCPRALLDVPPQSLPSPRLAVHRQTPPTIYILSIVHLLVINLTPLATLQHCTILPSNKVYAEIH